MGLSLHKIISFRSSQDRHTTEIKMSRRFHLCAAFIAAFVITSVAATQAPAQTKFPAKPIRIIVPLPPGNGVDLAVRLVADQFNARWGQPVIVENRPGAGGQLAAQAVASAPPDGYTLLAGTSGIFTILPAQNAKLPFDVNRDLTPIGLIGGGPMLIAVSSKLGVSSFAEFVALARAKPGQIVVGTNAAGTLPHFAALALQRKANIPINIVPYATGGTGEALKDLLGGQVHATIEVLAGLQQHVNSGDLRLIATMSPKRDPGRPQVAAVAESVPGLTAVGFMCLAARAGTPNAIVARLNEALRDAVKSPNVTQRLDQLGLMLQSTDLTPAETKAFIEGEEQQWWPIVREAAKR
jgi:tripartite-type tricarboxylate transporter receptor subunit TctC